MNRWDFLQCRRYDVKPGDRISVSLLLDDCFLSVNGCTFPELQPFYFMGFGKLPTIRLGKDGLTIF